ncbi:MAG TPA: tetratricopeptide repeat protein, partial [Anaerolineae bacterium]|nr:tetratricopeptide repeat protein [Anaerolineae bacterium]HIQ05840.1 tetratricopeptide repeat protein [Anaerolineae bacterium]
LRLCAFALIFLVLACPGMELVEKGMIAVKAGQFEQAAHLCEQAIELAPGWVPALNNQALALSLTGKYARSGPPGAAAFWYQPGRTRPAARGSVGPSCAVGGALA